MERSASDHALISFINTWKPVFEQVRLYWTHVSPSLEIPLLRKASYTQDPWDERYRDELYQDIVQELPATTLQDINILEGKPTDQLIHWTDVKRADMLILGYNPDSHEHALSLNKILRHVGISVWLVPQQLQSDTQEHHILIPVDFSANSRSALEYAIYLASLQPQKINLKLLHIFDLPHHSTYQTGYQQEEMITRSQNAIKAQMQEFTQSFDWKGIEFTPNILPNLHLNIASHIKEFALTHHCGTIILSAKGHSALSSFFLGSVTEQLVKLIKKPSLLVIRPDT